MRRRSKRPDRRSSTIVAIVGRAPDGATAVRDLVHEPGVDEAVPLDEPVLLVTLARRAVAVVLAGRRLPDPAGRPEAADLVERTRQALHAAGSFWIADHLGHIRSGVKSLAAELVGAVGIATMEGLDVAGEGGDERAVSGQARRPRVYPAPVGRCALRRVARAAQHRGVADVDRRTASRERDDVVDREVRGSVGGALVARAPVAVLTAPGAKHAGTESLPGPRAVQGVVPAAVGLPSVRRTPTARAAGDDTADRAQLHSRLRSDTVSAAVRLTLNTFDCTPFDIARSVAGANVVVYSPRVLRPGGQFLWVSMGRSAHW